MDLFNIVTGLIKTIDKTSTSILSSISFNFAVKKLASVGLEGLPTAIAWDPSQSLIAIASDTGKILLIGKSVEVMLESPKNWLNSPITHLLFEIGDAKLVAVNDSSQLGLWDISSFQGVCVDLKDPILNVQLYPTSSWIVLAFTSGLVKLMDINSLTYSNLLVPCDLNPDHRLNSIDINPSNFTQLLMGFDNEIIIWDFAQQRPNARFTHDDSKVISVRWDPEGVRFLSGHSSGELLVWTTKKKTTFLGSGKQPTKPVYETKFSSINHLDWIYVDEKRSTILIAGDQCVESLTVTSTDYKSAIKWTISLESPLKEFIFFSLEKDEYSIVAITSQKKLMHYTSTKVKKIELPSTLQFLSKSNHYNSTVCPDGFNLSSVVTRNIQKTYLLNSDASMILSNIEKNYDTMCISRKGELEFWLLSLPIPQYLYSIPVADTLDLSEALVSFDMMTNKLTIVSGNILNVYKFVGHQDPEAMMDNLDAALDQLMADTKIIQQLHSKPGQPDHDSKSDLVIVNQSEVDTDSYADQLVESGDSSPHSEIKTNGPSSNSKDANEKITNEPLDSIINSQRNSISLDFNPPFHLEDSYWISQVQITLNKPIISHSASLQLEMIVLATIDTFWVIDTNKRCVLLEERIEELENSISNSNSHLSVISKVDFSISVENHIPCVVIISNQSIFWYEVNEKNRVKTLSRYCIHESESKKSFENMKQIWLLDTQLNVLDLGKKNVYNLDLKHIYMIFVTNQHIFSIGMELDSIFTMAERDSDFGLIINSAICTFNEKRQFVLVTEDYILIYSLPDLMLIGKYPLGNIQNLSKKRLNECYISSKGFFGYWTKTDGWEMCALSANGPEITKPTVFDKYRARKWRLAHGKKSNDTPEAAQLFGQRLESKSPEVPIGIASELANALNERGEKLNEMQVKTGKLADASKTFVDTIKEYNKQQENKKWYQL